MCIYNYSYFCVYGRLHVYYHFLDTYCCSHACGYICECCYFYVYWIFQ